MRYIDADKLIEFITKGLNNPDKTKAFGYDAIEILTEIEYAPTADVVPKKEIANVLGDLKIAVHNKAHYNHAKEVPTYITIRELDAILQGFIEKWRVK
jgi:hypothetical protein